MLNEQLQEQIEQEAAQAASMQFHPKWSPDQNTACRITYRQGATEYAEKWQEAEDRIELLNERFNPIREWGQNEKSLPVGCSIPEEVLRRLKRYEKALKEILDIHKKYHDLNGDNPAANHLLNIAREALTPKTGSDDTDNG